jgi:hypothetical protein
MQAALEPAVREKQLCFFFSVVLPPHWEAFHRLGVQDVTEFDSDWCYVFCLLRERKKRKKKIETAWGFFLQGRTCLAGCAMQDFHSCLLQLKADLRVSQHRM